MTGGLSHLVVAPVLLPLATAVLMLLLGEGRRQIKAVFNLLSTVAGLLLALYLLWQLQAQGQPAAFGIYLPGNWSVPFGIVLCWTGSRP
jgi:multicomponent K+:H+ antiporter subunit D